MTRVQEDEEQEAAGNLTRGAMNKSVGTEEGRKYMGKRSEYRVKRRRKRWRNG